MKITLSMILDIIFYFIVFFILSFVLLNYFTIRGVAITLAICISSLINLIIFNNIYKKRQTTLLNKKQEKVYKKILTELNFSSNIEQNVILEKALLNAGYATKRRKNATVIQDKNAVIFMRFGFDSITKTELVKAFNNITKDETAYIVSESFEKEIEQFALRFNGKIILAKGKEFFLFLLKNDSLPKERFSQFNAKEKRASFSNLIEKKQAKNLFFFGLIFLIASYFVPIKLYYVVWGCLFLILSAIVKFFGKEEKNTSKERH